MSKKTAVKNNKIMATLLILLALIPMSAYVSVKITGWAEQDCWTQLHQIAGQVADRIEMQVAGDQQLLQSIANIIADQEYIDGPKVRNIIDTFQPNLMIDHIVLLMPGDLILQADSSIISVKELEDAQMEEELCFSRAAALGVHITDLGTDIRDGETKLLRSFVPVIKDGETVAMLYGTVNLESLTQQYIDKFNENQVYVYLIDGATGDFLMDSRGSGLSNVHDTQDGIIKEGQSVEQFIEDLGGDEPGYIVYTSPSTQEDTYLYYEPLTINNWMVAISISKSVAFARMYQIQRLLKIFLAGEIALLAVYLIWLWRTVSRDMREQKQRIALISYIHDVEKLLFTAHMKRGNVTKALMRIAQMAQAQEACFIQLDGNQIYRWREDGPVDVEEMRQSEKKLMEFARRGENVLCEYIMLVPIKNINEQVVGALGCMGMRTEWKDLQILERVEMSFSMLYNNMQSYSTIKVMGERDTLTGLLNRNRYENDLQKLPRRCHKNISCVYMDVNGLHELNNSRGHAVGDQMLRAVSKSIQSVFGTEKTYRIGGDEFVTFVLDARAETVDGLVRRVCALFERDGYHVSIGVCRREMPTDMHGMIKQAEERMYQDKRNYYEQVGKERRKSALGQDENTCAN